MFSVNLTNMPVTKPDKIQILLMLQKTTFCEQYLECFMYTFEK